MGGGEKSSSSSSSSFAPVSSSWFSRFSSSARRAKTLPAAPCFIDSSTRFSPGGGDALVRRLGLFDLILLGVGASIGAGIFVITGTVARDAGPGEAAPPPSASQCIFMLSSVTISFAIAGAACVLNALCYAELSSRFPAVVGGAYMYTYAAFNELAAFLVFTQLMLDYHIGAASISRSLASYVVTILELFPFFRNNIPSWIGEGGLELFGGILSINILAPIILVLLTIILCRGVGESSIVNSIMTATKVRAKSHTNNRIKIHAGAHIAFEVTIVVIVIIVGAFKVDVSNWSPFAPNGFKAIVSGATVVFFAYVGFDAVANSAEECKRPQILSDDAPLAEAFISKGSKYVSILISIGAVAGLTTTLLVGLYVQSRLYLGLGRDGLLPSIFARVNHKFHTPIHSQIWVCVVAAVMAGLFNVRALSRILSVGTLTGYSVVSACVVTLRWKDKATSQVSFRWISSWHEGAICLVVIACCGFGGGLCYRYGASFVFLLIALFIAALPAVALHYRQAYTEPVGFSCPLVPALPVISIFVNIFLFAQLHEEAWVRFVVLSIIAIVVYAIYGQYHADQPNQDQTIVYHRAPTTEDI
ncbi:Cationic amino acid transporter 9, chloroplastic [Asimina triloba]